MASKPIFFSLFLTVFFFQITSAEPVVKGAYWFPGSEFPLSDIDFTHFTHLFYAFVDLNPQTNQLTLSSSDLSLFSSFSRTIRCRNPSVKAIVSIRGGDANKFPAFSSAVSRGSSRKSFIQFSIKLARAHNFHGLDLHWDSGSTHYPPQTRPICVLCSASGEQSSQQSPKPPESHPF